MKVPLGKPYIKKEVVLKEIEKVLDRRWISGGPAIAEFEEAVKKYNGDDSGHYVAVANATVGLELALKTLSMGKPFPADAEVIVPSWSWVASAFAVLNVGAKPVWVDVNEYGVPDPRHVIRLMTSKTIAVIMVHQMGVPCDMDLLHNLMMERYGYIIPIIEDAACAFGSEYRGQKVGNIRWSGNEYYKGHRNLTVYSFQARKCLTTGEGGMIVTGNPAQAEWLRSMRAFGTTVSPLQRDSANHLLKEQFDKIGTNYKLSDVQAAMGLAHLSYFNEEVEKRIAAGTLYNTFIGDRFSPNDVQPANRIPSYCTRYNWQNYHVLLGEQYDRDRVVDLLRKKNIGCKWDIQAIHLEPAVSDTKTILPITERFHNSGLWLPFFAEITHDEQKYVIKTLGEVLNES